MRPTCVSAMWQGLCTPKRVCIEMGEMVWTGKQGIVRFGDVVLAGCDSQPPPLSRRSCRACWLASMRLGEPRGAVCGCSPSERAYLLRR
jgi:hypothetical protein